MVRGGPSEHHAVEVFEIALPIVEPLRYAEVAESMEELGCGSCLWSSSRSSRSRLIMLT
jgi:hypothetical protein